MQHVEIEYKLLVTQDIFKQILEDYQDIIKNDYVQTNHYFTHPLLREKKYMLRIREKNDQYELTLKRPFHNHRLETNINLSIEDKEKIFQHQIVHNEIMDILEEIGISQIELDNQFSLTTHRYDIELPEGILSLDESHYLDKQDYEIEFEVYDEHIGFQKFLEIIQPYSLNYKENCNSKIKRVLDSL